MKLHYISRKGLNNKSFTVTHHVMKSLLKLWHYHPELELVLTIRSEGTLFTGDSFNNFEAGDVVLLGKNLPHMWINDESYFKEDSELIAEDYVVHFKEDFLGESFFKITEMKSILALIERAKLGVKFLDVPRSLSNKIKELDSLEDFEKTLSLIRILYNLSKHNKYEPLASVGYASPLKQPEHSALSKVYEYIFQNFSKKITLSEAAKIANMNPSAFSRFFKRINKKSFSNYLIEVRLGYACKLLLEHDMSISSVCFESGFNNVSNFNRQFKSKKSYSPSEYKKLLRAGATI